jgi:hypothetical protein
MRQQCLYFFPLPQGHGSFRLVFSLDVEGMRKLSRTWPGFWRPTKASGRPTRHLPAIGRPKNQRPVPSSTNSSRTALGEWRRHDEKRSDLLRHLPAGSCCCQRLPVGGVVG